MKILGIIPALLFGICNIKTSAQSITLEGGSAIIPTYLASWTAGASLQIPITERFSVSASYYRWADNKDQQSLIDKYPIRDQFHPDYVFPQLTIKNSYWGNNVFALYAHYKPIMTEILSFEIGLGWSFLEYGLLFASIGVPDAGNGFSTNNKLGFRLYPSAPSPQRLSGLVQTRYHLSDNFALQGKIAAFGLEHFVATLGVSYMPWGRAASLADLFAPEAK